MASLSFSCPSSLDAHDEYGFDIDVVDNYDGFYIEGVDDQYIVNSRVLMTSRVLTTTFS